MELLIILLLCPIAFGQNHQKVNDPNEEPFLPIFPIYPYNPKLIKRGIEKETETQLTAELYAPKVDAKDSYTPNYNSNYQKDPYYPNYDPYQKTYPSSTTSYSPYYNNNPQATTTASYSTLPYNIYNTYTNPYTTSTSHTSIPSTAYSTSSYSTTAYPSHYSSNSYTGASYQPPPYVPVPNYYYQQPYYYPSYYAPPLFPPPSPPLPPFLHPDYSKDSDDKDSYENDSKKSEKIQKSKKDDKSRDTSGDKYTNDGNYITSNTNDLDSQSSSYKVANSYNQLEQTNEPREKSSGSGTYKIVNIRTQPSDTEYSIAATYAKTQQLEQLMRQTLAKFLAENTARQIIRYPTYDNKQNQLIKANELSYGNLNNYDNNNAQNFVPVNNGIAKTGLSYVVNPNALENFNSGSIVPRQVLETTPTTLTTSTKYLNDQYLRKPITLVSLQQSQGTYIPPNKSIKSSVSTQSSNYDGYENENIRINQNYDSPLDDTAGKQEEGYRQDQTSSDYKTQNFVTVQTPQTYSYQYASYHPQQTTNHQETQEYDDNTSDVEFGAKQSNKG
ncbi:mediator of RNA polymerase II transcription subunit 13-like [Vespa crabro]|uniref:mediator of RNA polymerase II transcription subunit 13-like n=1 Tax=Vespa crabro TaxID=7445 RepID=UPI001F005BC6|nr:mediator of RNA polymerase II transcription subunit 13-like [Vespa crabro]